MSMEEVWVPIKGFNKYAISNYGRVLNVKLNRVVKGSPRSGGIRIALLSPKGELEYRYLHRLIAETFIPKYKEEKQYRHPEIMKMLPFEIEGNKRFVPIKRRFIHVVDADKYFETVKQTADFLDADLSTVYRMLRGELIWMDHVLKYVWK